MDIIYLVFIVQPWVTRPFCKCCILSFSHLLFWCLSGMCARWCVWFSPVQSLVPGMITHWVTSCHEISRVLRRKDQKLLLHGRNRVFSWSQARTRRERPHREQVLRPHTHTHQRFKGKVLSALSASLPAAGSSERSKTFWPLSLHWSYWDVQGLRLSQELAFMLNLMATQNYMHANVSFLASVWSMLLSLAG